MSRKRWSGVVLAAIIGLCLLLVLPCAVQVRDGERWVWSANSLRQVGDALRSYREVHGKLPPAVVRDKDGRPLYSWRVALLPYIEAAPLYREFHPDEPWDSPHNKPLAGWTPGCYETPYRADGPGLTRVQVLVGPGTAFERDGLSWDDFPDGLENTLLVVESEEQVPWTKPGDLTYDPAGPLPRLGVYTKPAHFLCREVWRDPGYVGCFADGSTRFIPSSTDERRMRALITRNDGE